MILAPLQKFPKNVEDLHKLIVAKGFKKLPKVQKIANSGHTVYKSLYFLNSIGRGPKCPNVIWRRGGTYIFMSFNLILTYGNYLFSKQASEACRCPLRL